jgi:hypothetical protein
VVLGLSALVIVDRLIDIIGSKVGCAYNIGCAFATTLENSSLSEKVKDTIFHMMVSAFYDYAHNQTCQLEKHPLYIKGTGHSDGEGCEHVFTSSNDLACGTCHVSHFHHHQAIEEHFMFWDQDKYANVSKII